MIMKIEVDVDSDCPHGVPEGILVPQLPFKGQYHMERCMRLVIEE